MIFFIMAIVSVVFVDCNVCRPAVRWRQSARALRSGLLPCAHTLQRLFGARTALSFRGGEYQAHCTRDSQLPFSAVAVRVGHASFSQCRSFFFFACVFFLVVVVVVLAANKFRSFVAKFLCMPIFLFFSLSLSLSLPVSSVCVGSQDGLFDSRFVPLLSKIMMVMSDARMRGWLRVKVFVQVD